MNRHLTLTLTALLIGQADLTYAQEGGRGRNREPGHPLIRILDANRDGVLSRDEWEQTPAVLQKLDANGDATVSWDELRQGQPQRGAPQGRPCGGERGRPGGPAPLQMETSSVDLGEPGIAWYGRLDLAKAEAKIAMAMAMEKSTMHLVCGSPPPGGREKWPPNIS